jgi:hypothetical protein
MNIREYAVQAAKVLIANPNFQADVAEARRKNLIPSQGLLDDASKESWYSEHINLRLNAEEPLNEAVAAILLQFRLGPDWRHSIKRYILLNNPNDMQLPEHIEMGLKLDEDTGRWRVVVNIPEFASYADIKAAIPAITELQNAIRGKPLMRQPSHNQELAEEAYAIHRQVKSYAKTATILSEKMGTKIEWQSVRDLIRSYKIRVGLS